jgi:site-specific DNA-methyltransferase (adenine-specific)
MLATIQVPPLKELDFWIINDIIWFKRNATPLLSKNRLAPSTELIWLASKSKNYFFDYETAKELNGGKQMKNLWEIPAERHLTEHPTEKPETLLHRVILLGSKIGDTIFDPFMGSGTTGAVAKNLGRKFLGIEIDAAYFNMTKNRIMKTPVELSLL